MNDLNVLEHKYKTKLYFGLSFLITWLAGFTIAFQSHTGREKSILLLFLAYMGPMIAAFITYIIDRDKIGFVDFKRRVINPILIKPKYFLVALFLMPMAMLVSIGISIIFGQPIGQLQITEEFAVFNGELVLSMVILALVPVLEELGWRSYGVDAIRSKNNLFRTSLYFGLLWGVWHLPVFFIKGSYQASLWQMNPVYALNFFVGIVPLAFIMNYLYYKNKRSVLLLSIFHIMVNYSSEIFRANQISKCILTLVLMFISYILYLKDKKFFIQ